ncbi:hypothetical protein RJ640_006072 [Escallonia rubra]|uniref:Chaoptin n=1 Tax=Escallonia rubra TaxID=112253 RepID=A0AA88UFM9_9ASTE|nr:hypothetical protein RJ640_006072 [Escallonia rubra]
MSSPKPLQLAANNFTANDSVLVSSLPASIENLTKLRTISIPHHLLLGEIQAAIRRLSSLQVLELQGNNFSGAIPRQLRTDPFEAEVNQIVGSIPPKIGSLKKFKRLELSKNRLSGSLLDQLGEIKELKRILLEENNLT